MTAREEIDALRLAAEAQGGAYTETQRLRLCELIPLEQRETAQAGRAAALARCPFVVDDQVLHKSGGSTARGADARVGIVQAVYAAQDTAHTWRTKLAIDWPAPRRINGDGWHRSDALASAVIAATDEEIERRRALNRAVNERNQARWGASVKERA